MPQVREILQIRGSLTCLTTYSVVIVENLQCHVLLTVFD